MQAETDAPLILTMEFASPWQDWAQDLRLRHFPKARNIVPAHVTLFHALPPNTVQGILPVLRDAGEAPVVRIDAPYLLGRGVAYRLHSAGLSALRATIVARLGVEILTRQDAAAWRPHLTIQNKVEPDHARRTFEALALDFEPIVTHAAALRLWRYEGGPWTLLERFAFAPSGSVTPL